MCPRSRCERTEIRNMIREGPQFCKYGGMLHKEFCRSHVS
jgi:hypothetical protein